MIPVYSNSLGDEEIEEITKVIHSKWLGMGKHCSEFEKELGQFWKTPHVLLVNNCTAALSISLKTLGIGPGDEVIVSSINFVGCANAVLEVGATPVFADVDAQTLNILPEEIDRLKTPQTKAVYILHYGGHPCDFGLLEDVCNGIPILEDSANSVASTYHGKYCGTLGAVGTFSFDAMKTLVMGDGGAMIFKDPEAYAKAQSFRYLGFHQETTSGASALKSGKDRWWEFDLDCHSGRFISNDILASVGRVQLKKLPGFLKRRKEIWEYYQNNLASVQQIKRPPDPLPNTTSSYYMYWVYVEGRRDELASYLAEKGIYTTFRYFPLHLVPYYKSGVSLKNAEAMNQSILNIPLHQNLSDGEVNQIVEAIKEFYK